VSLSENEERQVAERAYALGHADGTREAAAASEARVLEEVVGRFWRLSQRGDMVIKFAGMIQAECRAILAAVGKEPT
jgi:hypothetical protein